ncbi:hypothetical protein N199_03370 [Helicobacter pylori UM038]|uniref:Uncharacterized protein n=1 Tax=Helicobacter pylori UM038 TaxID=1352343 RepID=A0AAV3JMG7_HELPX|nr:hypothetical protein N199_03370 [Helicobacter pylori UM038]
MSIQTLKNKAFRVSIQWNALVRKLLSLERGAPRSGLARKPLV